MMNCKICNSESDVFFNSKILDKYDVSYYKCNCCGFVQTENPHWLDEAYSNAITSQDIGLLSRNVYYAPIVSSIIKFFFKKEANFLDYGGGYGVFVRLMRDRGFNFYRYDKYCVNMFSKGYDDDDKTNYELITAFEVFEHLVYPVEEIQNMLKKSRNIIFSTELQPKNFKNEMDWWYVMPETGQHISLYSIETLQFIAKQNKLNLYSNNSTFHLLTDKKISNFQFKIATNRYTAKIFNKIFKYPDSLLMKDYYKIVNTKE
ncbi:class I SAM-dependent methyltransferase [Flavobacterium pectinovorum]|uniref:class I SAM-dependent methyltransferase n=1 Tax=Flavobacterium pectinovorum TaxID=29533 RepID=UPI00265F28E7|nr:class I SAM-dependent methyltransferase [Flavobacterium pectinovorum]WKL45997.1 class I SAM-dependent methyltransferase [Flavobacterium pectinovorum]